MPQCRCSSCSGRRTLQRFPDEYIRTPQCRRCGSRRLRHDRYRATHEVGQGAPKPCRCGEYQGRDGNNMPHRKGSGWCVHNPRILDADRQHRWESGSRTRCN